MDHAVAHRLHTQKVTVRLLIAALAALATGAPARADEPLARGQIVDRVVCKADPSKSYALYLPSSYTPERKWPILYCFDPAARGRLPVERFRDAAERFGWIVAGSYDSQNGPIEDSMKAGIAVWADTHARFAIDERRIYTTGFSGGARVAAWAAISCDGCIAGVIACGAGFPGTLKPGDSRLPGPLKFVYFATIGTDDFNFPELKLLDAELEAHGVAHHVARFDGPHDWAPVPLTIEAVGWMEMAAMRAGTRAKDAALVEALYAEGLETARAEQDAGRPLEAWIEYDRLVGEFRGLRDTTEIEGHAKELRKSKEVRSALSREEDEVKRQQRFAGEAAGFASARADQDQRLIANMEFHRRIDTLKKQSRAEEDSSERRVARRALHQIFAYYFETGRSLVSGGKYGEAAELLSVAAEIAPKWPDVFYDLAAARARSGDAKKAFEALRQAVDAGFADAARLRTDPAFESLRADPEFARILDTIHPAGS